MESRKPVLLGSSLFAVLLVFTILPSADFSTAEFETTQSDSFLIKGIYTFTVTDQNGVITHQQVHENLVTNEAMECTADHLFGTTECTGESTFVNIAIGTGGGATVDTDTTLTTESGVCTRITDATPTVATGVSGERPVTVDGIFIGIACEGIAFAEVGIFDSAVTSTGNMLSRTEISPPITLGSGDSLDVNYEVELNNT